MTRPPAPYARVRLFTTLITAAIWFLILYLSTAFARGGRGEHMPPLEMAIVVGFVFLLIPYFTTHGMLMSLAKSMLAGRIILPEPTQAARSDAALVNPWRQAATNAVVFGLMPAGIGFFLANGADQATMTRGVFAVRYALTGALLCATVGWVTSGQPALRILQKPREQRAFAGTPDQYLSRYYSLPHGIANLLINAMLAFALSPVPASQVGAIVPVKNVVGDTVIALLVLTWLLTSSAKGQARNETLLGIAPPSAASNKSILKALSGALLWGIGFTVVVGVLFAVTKTPGLGVWSWAVYRGVVFGVYAAWITRVVAQAAINTTLHAEPGTNAATSTTA